MSLTGWTGEQPENEFSIYGQYFSILHSELRKYQSGEEKLGKLLQYIFNIT